MESQSNFSWAQLPSPFWVLAPMEDVTDAAYRRLVAECAPPHVFFSEFTSADGMFSRGEEKVVHRLERTEYDSPLIAQIWGNNPENYFKAAKRIVELGFDGLDINMGCPVDKIIKGGHCSALIENPPLAAELIQAAREGAPTLALSVKTRCGFQDWRTEEWSGFLLSQNIDALTIHGRISKHLSKKPARWDEIAKVVALRDQAKVETVIIGNGDISSLAEARDRVSETGADGVMIGRGIFDNLFVFDDTVPPLIDRSTEEKLSLLLRHFELFQEHWQGRKHFRVLKKFFKNYARGFRGASELRMALVESETAEEFQSKIQLFLQDETESVLTTTHAE